MRDADVRNAVRQQLRRDHGRDCSTRIVEEMGVWSGTVRIDLAVINGELSGYELKSDRDTLDRLPAQASMYSRVFDRVTLVVGSKHAEKAAAQVPKWWGIIVARSEGNAIVLVAERDAAMNPAPDAYLIAQLLWKDEALSVLDSIQLSAGWRSKRVKAIHEHLAKSLPLDILRARVREALKLRDDWLRHDRSSQFDMPVHADPHPIL